MRMTGPRFHRMERWDEARKKYDQLISNSLFMNKYMA